MVQKSIFISHSSKDIIVARAVRNLLEDRDHHVLLLGLLQDLTDQEILDLLEGEVEARDWLVFIDTPNSRASSWVQFELDKAEEYNKTMYIIKGEEFESDDRHRIEIKLRPCIERFSRGLRIFLSYSKEDGEDVAHMLDDKLEEKGYEVRYDAEDTSRGPEFLKHIKKSMKTAMERGVFISVITPEFLKDKFLMTELDHALRQDGMILPIFIGDVDMDAVPKKIREIDYVTMAHESSLEDQMMYVYEMLDKIRIKHFEGACGG